MKDSTLGGIILIAVYGIGGIGTGLLFSKAMYHKGKAKAYEEISERLQEVIKEGEKIIAAQKSEES